MMARPVRMPAKSKYHAAPTVVDGIRFDSKREAQRYGELKLLAKAGEIHSLERQVEFALCTLSRPQWEDTARVSVRVVAKYVADFTYYDRHGHRHVEDVKGVRTAMYVLKKKWLELQDGIQIREVR